MSPAPKDADAHPQRPAQTAPLPDPRRWRRELERVAWWAAEAARWTCLKVAKGLRDIGLSWYTGGPQLGPEHAGTYPAPWIDTRELLDEPPPMHPECLLRGSDLSRDEWLWREEMGQGRVE
jgi:hypothetical protein